MKKKLQSVPVTCAFMCVIPETDLSSRFCVLTEHDILGESKEGITDPLTINA